KLIQQSFRQAFIVSQGLGTRVSPKIKIAARLASGVAFQAIRLNEGAHVVLEDSIELPCVRLGGGSAERKQRHQEQNRRGQAHVWRMLEGGTLSRQVAIAPT